MLGRRQPEIYGSQTFEAFFEELVAKYGDVADLSYYQSNHEGALIDKLHEVGFSFDGIVLNAGGYTHTSIALADAVSSIEAPVIEVHISDIHSRESFRQHSYLTPVCVAYFIGKGLPGYQEAIEFFFNSEH